jgi:hypothetical protein
MAETSADASAFQQPGRQQSRRLQNVRRRSRWSSSVAFAVAFLVLAFATSISASAQSSTRQLAVPPPETLLLLIRTTLVALNHANQTGNYTVLRDIAAPVFQQKFAAADLGTIFAKLRARRLDLAPVVIVTPELSTPPAISPEGHLTVAGNFPTQPAPILFQLVFVASNGLWKLAGITVDVAEPPPARPAEKQKPAAPAVNK